MEETPVGEPPMLPDGPDPCDPISLTEAVKGIDDLYVSVLGDKCGACAEFRKDLEGAEIPHPVLEVSADQCPRLADHFNVRVTPTVLRLKKGQVVSTFEGRDALEKMKQGL